MKRYLDANLLAMLQSQLTGTLLVEEPLARHTSYGIGGPVEAFITPDNREELATLLRLAHDHALPVYIIGSGSNLLVADEGLPGLAICLEKVFNRVAIQSGEVYAEAGVKLNHLVHLTMQHHLRGLETLGGIPGTVGGALVMNAGAFGTEISKVLVSVEIMTAQGVSQVLLAEDLQFGYRCSSFRPEDIILGATFHLTPDDPQAIQARYREVSQKRRQTQPLNKRSVGSIFKNPKTGLSAGSLIDQAGLKGTRHGDAEISTLHANFFINHGQAQAADIVALIRLAREKVKKQFGIHLELEVTPLGFAPGTMDA
ncbi:MAG: UDP-N-acetylmuramate dehydrogenase [Fidelibacterota bacterium]